MLNYSLPQNTFVDVSSPKTYFVTSNDCLVPCYIRPCSHDRKKQIFNFVASTFFNRKRHTFQSISCTNEWIPIRKPRLRLTSTHKHRHKHSRHGQKPDTVHKSVASKVITSPVANEMNFHWHRDFVLYISQCRMLERRKQCTPRVCFHFSAIQHVMLCA